MLLAPEFLAKNNIVAIPQSSYSPDMAVCDLFLFPKIKRTYKGTQMKIAEKAEDYPKKRV